MKLGYEDWEFNLRLLKNELKLTKLQNAFHYHVSNHGMLNSISKIMLIFTTI